ncbi:MAG: DUF2723 domain-containing protein [Bacteroidaceae bacterium]
MKQYKKINNLVGWLIFIIASTVYALTVEPSASFWDCPEFITTSYNLEIGHPPGAPFFMLMANLFTQFASDATHVAYMVNIMSALMSGGCILFLFWTITMLVKKLVAPGKGAVSMGNLITILGSGAVGSLVYAFSDTFWFSAVEAEVYATSSLFTAVVFWLILKWEQVANEEHSDKWIVLIAYLTGLSIGVHLLNLLCIPAIVLVYYFKKHPQATIRQSAMALFVAMVIIAAVLYGIVPGIVKIGGWFELLFVNQLGFSFNSGLIVYLLLFIGSIIGGIYTSFQGKKTKWIYLFFLLTIALSGTPFYGHGTTSVLVGVVLLSALAFYLFTPLVKEKYKLNIRSIHTTLLCVMMIGIGYSSYALIVIRSSANPPMDQNSPEDIFSLGDYLGREQYGERPLLYGRAYTSTLKTKVEGRYITADIDTIAPVYRQKVKENATEKDQYSVVNHKTKYHYMQNMLFPRMYSKQHASLYENWMTVGGKTVTYFDEVEGQPKSVKMPTQWDNVKFFLSYQLNFMYWRYFMWNFAGRQNDLQGNGELEHGNWITGIAPIDNLLVGDQSKLPDLLANNKGHNVYYCLPLLLGILGIFWQANRGNKGIQSFWVVFFLFFMTGIAIVLYLNQTPMQPRERDYAYAGSFYAFTIWIGMGVAAVTLLLRKYLNETTAAALATAGCLLIPLQMAAQNWDDHDRSGRYTARDFGSNYLMSLPQKGNPIIYTNGDNDTFPLWYNQEVEKNRTDVRVCNLSYLQTDWYIDQMVRPSLDSPGIPIDWQPIEYAQGKNEYVPILLEAKDKILKIIKEQPEAAKKEFGENPFELKTVLNLWVRKRGMIPTDELEITLDKAAIRRSGMLIPAALHDSIPDKMIISLKGKKALYKSELMMLEMLANTNWERPIYMATTVGKENHLNLDKYFIQEGLAYRISPFNAESLGASVDSEKMYDNIMYKFKFGNINDPANYLDETVMRMCQTHRRMFVLLINQLLKEGKKEKAINALTYCEQMIPSTTVPYEDWYGTNDLATAWFKVGQLKKGENIIQQVVTNATQFLEWYYSMDNYHFNLSSERCLYYLSILDAANRTLTKYNSEQADQVAKTLDVLYNQYIAKAGLTNQLKEAQQGQEQ